MVDWVRVDDSVPEIADEPWSLFWHEFKSDAVEFDRILKDPLSVLKQDFPEIDETWNINTELLNHQAGLLLSAVCSATFVFPEIKMVKILYYKH